MMNISKNQAMLIIAAILLVTGLVWFMFARGGPGQENYAGTPRTQFPFASEGVAAAPAADGVVVRDTGVFDDGLRNPISRDEFELDEFGEGIASIETYAVEINGRNSRIVKTRHENGTAHFHYEYNILLDGPDGANITPPGFRTIEGADCSLQKLRFVFTPYFHVIKISRGWEESWVTPTMASRTIYYAEGGRMRPTAPVQLGRVCDVSDLF